MPELGSDRSDEEHNEMMTNRTDAQPCKVSAELRAPKAKKTKRENCVVVWAGAFCFRGGGPE